jgi:hypothetical protein
MISILEQNSLDHWKAVQLEVFYNGLCDWKAELKMENKKQFRFVKRNNVKENGCFKTLVFIR